MPAKRNKRSQMRANWSWPRYALRLSGMAMILTSVGLLARHGEIPPTATAQVEAPRQAAPPPVGHLVTVKLPISGNSDQAVRTHVERILESQAQRDNNIPAVIVLEFGDEDQTGAGSEFGRSYELARYLLSEDLQGARTVAYVPYRLEGHALLVAMACQEIVMHQDAELGRADGDPVPIGNVEREAYEDISAQRQTLPRSRTAHVGSSPTNSNRSRRSRALPATRRLSSEATWGVFRPRNCAASSASSAARLPTRRTWRRP